MKKHEKGIAIAIIAVLIVGLLTVMVLLMGIVAKAEFVIAESGLRVRKEPNLDAEVTRVIPFGEEVEGTVTNGWMKTKDGFVSAEFLSETDPLAGYTALGRWMLTAYTHTGNACANGQYPTAGYTVACNSLPLGTEIYIQGIGRRVVEDRGTASMPSGWCDIFMDGYSECIQFGEKTAEVYLIPEKEMP